MQRLGVTALFPVLAILMLLVPPWEVVWEPAGASETPAPRYAGYHLRGYRTDLQPETVVLDAPGPDGTPAGTTIERIPTTRIRYPTLLLQFAGLMIVWTLVSLLLLWRQRAASRAGEGATG